MGPRRLVRTAALVAALASSGCSTLHPVSDPAAEGNSQLRVSEVAGAVEGNGGNRIFGGGGGAQGQACVATVIGGTDWLVTAIEMGAELVFAQGSCSFTLSPP